MSRNNYYKPGKVLHTILDGNDPELKKNKLPLGWDSLGIIFFAYTDSHDRNAKETSNLNVAKPLYSNIKHYPLVNEIVYIISMPDPGAEEDPYSNSYYYISTVNLWNHPHHNIFPFLNATQLNEAYSKNPNSSLTYEMIQNGLSKNEFSSNDKSINIFGETFKEKKDIKPLLPFEGDIIYEGRYGQSIRFGSTVRERNNRNNYSSEGINGDPITIIRNGQSYSGSKDGWIPTVEDINYDGSSIYMCQNQVIKIDVSSKNLRSFNTYLNSVPIDVVSIDNPPTPLIDVTSPTPVVVDKTEKLSNFTAPIVTPTTSPSSKKVYTEDELTKVDNPLNTETEQFIVEDVVDVEDSTSEVVKPVTYTPKEKEDLVKAGVKLPGLNKPAIKDNAAKVALNSMIANAKEKGVNIIVVSGFRTKQKQIELRIKAAPIGKKKDDDFIMNAPSSQFSPVTAKPGTSHHELGFAFDLNTNDLNVYRWLKENAYKYDFIRTVQSEKWHWEHRPDLNKQQYAKVKSNHPTWVV
jgi:LAS superfamily LD-carboxypeptidase LdcB